MVSGGSVGEESEGGTGGERGGCENKGEAGALRATGLPASAFAGALRLSSEAEVTGRRV